MTPLQTTTERPDPTTAPRSAASARLGGTLRRVLVSPSAGYRAAFALIESRTRAAARVPEGAAPYVLGCAGGAQFMLLWLEVGGLVGLRSVAGADFRWSYVAVAAAGGAVLAVIAQYLWGPVGRVTLARLGAPASSSRLRLVWGAAALPQLVGLVVLLPLDLAIVGRDLFVSDRISSALSAGWAALSVALCVSLAAWSAYLFYKGVRTAAGASPAQAIVAVAAAAACLALVAGGFLLGAVLVAGGAS